VGKKQKRKKKRGQSGERDTKKCKLQVVGTNKPINHLNSAAPAVKVVVAIQLHDPIHRSQSQSSQPIGGTPFENTTNLDSLIHSLNFPSYHACLLAGGMVCTSHLSSAQPISEPKQKDGMTSDPESLSAETGRQLLLACIRKIFIS
jgi:hypothetical protein